MKKIYVICPAYYKTGGTELLHQLVFVLNSHGYSSEIVYPNATSEQNINPAFKKYCSDYARLSDVKNEDALFVISEIQTNLLLTSLLPQKCVIWWESVDNYYTTFSMALHQRGLLRAINQLRKNVFFKANRANFSILKMAQGHLCQSMYAFDYLRKHKITNNVYFLKDYINDDYFDKSGLNLSKKENIILYNPKKGKKITTKIRRKFADFHFVPLINMTNEQVRENLEKAKVYIDFGNHPGMDRFPREAVTMHCCVITNRIGSANYQEDVPIDDKYKFDDYHLDYKLLRKTIEYCFDNYLQTDKEFDSYRSFVASQKEEFIKDTKEVFAKFLRE